MGENNRQDWTLCKYVPFSCYNEGEDTPVYGYIVGLQNANATPLFAKDQQGAVYDTKPIKKDIANIIRKTYSAFDGVPFLQRYSSYNVESLYHSDKLSLRAVVTEEQNDQGEITSRKVELENKNDDLKQISFVLPSAKNADNDILYPNPAKVIKLANNTNRINVGLKANSRPDWSGIDIDGFMYNFCFSSKFMNHYTGADDYYKKARKLWRVFSTSSAQNGKSDWIEASVKVGIPGGRTDYYLYKNRLEIEKDEIQKVEPIVLRTFIDNNALRDSRRTGVSVLKFSKFREQENIYYKNRVRAGMYYNAGDVNTARVGVPQIMEYVVYTDISWIDQAADDRYSSDVFVEYNMFYIKKDGEAGIRYIIKQKLVEDKFVDASTDEYENAGSFFIMEEFMPSAKHEKHGNMTLQRSQADIERRRYDAHEHNYIFKTISTTREVSQLRKNAQERTSTTWSQKLMNRVVRPLIPFMGHVVIITGADYVVSNVYGIRVSEALSIILAIASTVDIYNILFSSSEGHAGNERNDIGSARHIQFEGNQSYDTITAPYQAISNSNANMFTKGWNYMYYNINKMLGYTESRNINDVEINPFLRTARRQVFNNAHSNMDKSKEYSTQMFVNLDNLNTSGEQRKFSTSINAYGGYLLLVQRQCYILTIQLCMEAITITVQKKIGVTREKEYLGVIFFMNFIRLIYASLSLLGMNSIQNQLRSLITWIPSMFGYEAASHVFINRVVSGGSFMVTGAGSKILPVLAFSISTIYHGLQFYKYTYLTNYTKFIEAFTKMIGESGVDKANFNSMVQPGVDFFGKNADIKKGLVTIKKWIETQHDDSITHMLPIRRPNQRSRIFIDNTYKSANVPLIINTDFVKVDAQ